MPDTKPKCLDLFCSAGGATRGLQQAGFHVTGVDIKPQPRYCGDAFIQADALRVDLVGYDFIWASPPCQAYTIANNIHGRHDHPRLIEPIRARLQTQGVTYVIENVPRAPLVNPILICGRALGLNVKRHRLFECSFSCMGTRCPPGHPGDWLLIFGHTVLNRGKTIGWTKGGKFARIHRVHQGTQAGRDAMGIDWMSRDELSEAIPPAYSKYIGEQVMRLINGKNKV